MKKIQVNPTANIYHLSKRLPAAVKSLSDFSQHNQTFYFEKPNSL